MINSCKTAEELVKLATENNMEITLAEAENYFSKGFNKLSDEDLDKVAGDIASNEGIHSTNNKAILPIGNQ